MKAKQTENQIIYPGSREYFDSLLKKSELQAFLMLGPAGLYKIDQRVKSWQKK
jgi:hypothetical protein